MIPTPTSSATPAAATASHLTWAGGGATILAALIAAAMVTIGYFFQQWLARRQRRLESYAQALRAVHDYLETPYLIRRRDGSTDARRSIIGQINEIQSRLNYHCALLQLHGPKRVSDAYDDLVRKARREAGAQMKDAWTEPAATQDADMSLGRAYAHPEADAALDTAITAMRKKIR